MLTKWVLAYKFVDPDAAADAYYRTTHLKFTVTKKYGITGSLDRGTYSKEEDGFFVFIASYNQCTDESVAAFAKACIGGVLAELPGSAKAFLDRTKFIPDEGEKCSIFSNSGKAVSENYPQCLPTHSFTFMSIERSTRICETLNQLFRAKRLHARIMQIQMGHVWLVLMIGKDVFSEEENFSEELKYDLTYGAPANLSGSSIRYFFTGHGRSLDKNLAIVYLNPYF